MVFSLIVKQLGVLIPRRGTTRNTNYLDRAFKKNDTDNDCEMTIREEIIPEKNKFLGKNKKGVVDDDADNTEEEEKDDQKKKKKNPITFAIKWK